MQAYNKAIVALIAAIILVVNTFFGLNINIDPEIINAIVAILTPILVYLVPNKPKTK